VDPAAGLRAQARAARILKSLVQAGDVEKSGELLAKTYYGMASALMYLMRRSEAAQMWKYTVELREWLFAQDLPVAQALAETYIEMAKTCAEGYPEGALEMCNRTVRLLAKAKDGNPLRLVILAEAEVVSGLALGSQGHYGNGAQIADHGIAKLAKLAELRPEARAYLAEAVARRAMMAEAAQRRAEAMRHWDRAIALYQEVVVKDGKFEFESELDQFVEMRARLAAGGHDGEERRAPAKTGGKAWLEIRKG
jgi:tetratricopeptide (TPR) repeat protein